MRKKNNIIIFIYIVIPLILISLFLIFAFYQKKVIADKYNNAIEEFNNGNYSNAIEILNTLQNYKNANVLKQEAEQEVIYINANDLLNQKQYDKSIEEFAKIQEYKDSSEKIIEAKYNLALEYFWNEDYDSAKKIFIEIKDYLESEYYLAQIDVLTIEQSQKIVYEKANTEFESGNYEEALKLFETIIDYSDSNIKIVECKQQIRRRNLNNFIAAGVRCSAAITDTGEVIVIGANDDGQCNTQDWNNIISIDTYGSFTIGLTKNGNVKVAGKNNGKIIDTSNWKQIIDIATGERFVIALKQDGTVLADGHNGDHQIEVADWKDVIAIDAGWNFAVGLTKDKELLFSGIDNGQKQQFDKNKDEWKDVINISASGGGNTSKRRGKGHTVGLKSDGTVVAIGDNSFGQCEVKDWNNIIKIVAGDWYTVGLKNDGTILITGENIPNTRYIDEEKIKECQDIIDIAAGFGQTLCLKSDGTVVAFGFDDNKKNSGTAEWKNLYSPSE